MITYFKPHINVIRNGRKKVEGTLLALDIPFQNKKDAKSFIEENKDEIIEKSHYDKIISVDYRKYGVYENVEECDDTIRLRSPAATKEMSIDE